MDSKQYKYLNKLLIKALKGNQKETLKLALCLGVTYTYLKANLAILNHKIDEEVERSGLTRDEVIKKLCRKEPYFNH